MILLDPSIIVFGGTVVLGIVGYFGKNKIEEIRARREAFLSHIKMCNEKTTAFALLEQKVKSLEAHIENDRLMRDWIGDCVQNIAGRLNVDLPERPQ